MSRDLPERARCFLDRASGGSEALRSVRAVNLRMHGDLRVGDEWRRFRASEQIDPHAGFVWRATVRAGLFPIRGFDRYLDGRGEMRWRMLGLVPLVSARGEDLDRSARGRLALEAVWVPPALHPSRGVRWRELDDGWLRAEWKVGGQPVALEVDLDGEGRPRAVRGSRWGNPDEKGWRELPFGGRVAGETRFGGLTIASRLSVGWWFGTERFESEGEFFRAVVDRAEPAG